MVIFLKKFVVVVIEGLYIILSWPFRWLLKRLLKPKRARWLFFSFGYAAFSYGYLIHGYEWGNVICKETKWLFCGNSNPPRPELILWRQFYSVPILIGFVLYCAKSFYDYWRQVESRLVRRKSSNCGEFAWKIKRMLWWL